MRRQRKSTGIRDDSFTEIGSEWDLSRSGEDIFPEFKWKEDELLLNFRLPYFSTYLLVMRPEMPFDDVKQSSYCYDGVKWAVEQGITGGISENRFAPNDPCTRAQIVTFLWRAAGSPSVQAKENPFKDVSETDYYYPAVLWAIENGITSGTGAETFSPNATCTRAQSAALLYRSKGAAAAGVSDFADVAKDAYYADAVAWAAEKGTTSGTGNGLFSPDAFCTRAQICLLHQSADCNFPLSGGAVIHMSSLICK